MSGVSPVPGTPQTKTKALWAAVLGFIAPGAVVIGSAVTDASDGGTTITGAEIVTAIVAAVVTAAASGVAVAKVQNQPL